MKRILFPILILFFACFSNSYAQQDTLKIPVQKMQVTKLATEKWNIDSVLWHNEYDWISYQMKVAMTEGEDKLAFQCFFVNRTDSLMYFNLYKSGIELARIVLTPDSVVFVNKLEKQFYRGGYEFFRHIIGLPLTFPIVQSLLNARDFRGFSEIYHTNADGALTHYIWPQRTRGDISIMQDIAVDTNRTIVQNSITDLKKMVEAVFNYQDYSFEERNFNPDGETTKMDTLAFFKRLQISMPAGGVSIDAEIKNLKVNVPGPTSIKIPDSFTAIIMHE